MEQLSFPQLPSIFESMVNQIDEGILIVDANQEDSPIIFANKGFNKITGYEPNEVIGKNPRFLKGPETDVNVANMIRDCIYSKRNGAAYILNYKKDGSTFWNHLSIAPIIDNEGNVSHWIGIERDISPIIEKVKNKSEEKSMAATIHTVNDIINNFLNSLTFFRESIKNCPYSDDNHLQEFDEVYHKFSLDFKRLNQIERYKERDINNNFSTLDLE